MEVSDKKDEAKGAKTVAAINVGANAVRMVIAEVLPDGRIEVIERLQRATPPGARRLSPRSPGHGQHARGPGHPPRFPRAPETLQGRATPGGRHECRPRGQQRRYVSRSHFPGHGFEGRSHRHAGRKPPDGLGGAAGPGRGLGRHAGRGADRQRRRRQHALDPAPRRGDRHVAEPAAGVRATAGGDRQQRGLARADGRGAALPGFDDVGIAAECPAAEQCRILRRGWRRCPLCRPPDRPADRFTRSVPHRSPRIRQAGRRAASTGLRKTWPSDSAFLLPRPRPSIRPSWSTRTSSASRRPRRSSSPA